MKKTVAFLMALSLMLCLTTLLPLRSSAALDVLGEGPDPTQVSVDPLLTEAFSNLNAQDSMHMDMKIALEINILVSAGGQTMSMPMSIDLTVDMDQQKEPACISSQIEMSMSSMGQTENKQFLLYMEQDDETTTTYSSADGGASWNANKADRVPVDPTEVFSIIINNSKGFQQVGTDTLDGREVLVYTGALSGEFLQQIMNMAGSGSSLSELIPTDGAEASAVEFGDMPITMFIDAQTHLPLRYTMDMGDMMKDLLGNVLKSLMGLEGMDGVEVDVDFPAASAECFLSEFNSVPPIEIPAAAKAAVPAAA